MKKFDLLIVGSGLSGAVVAHEATKLGKRCLVLERRDHTGGNIHCKKVDGIDVHQYGAHIFHTDNQEIWMYLNNITPFNNFINSPIANYKGKLYNLPFNMNTFYQIWGVITPQQAQEIIDKQKGDSVETPQNLEEQAIKLVGRDIFETLIRGYTEKQWGRQCNQLPAFIIKRLPVRFTYDNNYFSDRYQGIPINGYNEITDKLLEGSEVITKADYNQKRQDYDGIADIVVYTGMIDEYFNYCFGALEYRSLEFIHEKHDIENYQGVAAMNFTDRDTPYTRIIEHKHFLNTQSPTTVITKEYPKEWTPGDEAYYPVNNDENQKRFEQYWTLAQNEKNVYFIGRLAQYKYYDMWKTVDEALKVSRKISQI